MNDRDLDGLYRRASAQDSARPSGQVRESILAHAARVASRCPKPLGAGRWLVRLWSSSRTRSWRIVAPVAVAALAAAILVPLWRSPAPSGATFVSDEEPPAIAAGPRTPPAPAPPLAAEQPEQRLALPAALPPPRAQAPLAVPSEAAGADVAPAAATPSSNRARSAPALPNENAAEFGQRAQRASVARTRQSSSPDRDAPARQIQQAALSGHTERLARLLSEHPALIDADDELGRTPLMLATLSGQDGTVALLLAHGANPNIPDAAGRAPLEVARAKGETTITDELLRAR